MAALGMALTLTVTATVEAEEEEEEAVVVEDCSPLWATRSVPTPSRNR